MAATVGSSVDPSVDPVDSFWRAIGFKGWKDYAYYRLRTVRTNLASDLLRVVNCPNEKDRERGLRSVQEDFTRYQDERRSALANEDGNVSSNTKITWTSNFRNDPDSVEAENLRDRLIEENGDNFNDMAYDIINMIPDADWMEFARNALKVDETAEEMITLRHSSVNREGKYQMIKNWRKRMLRTGQDASAERLRNLAIDFLTRKGVVGNIGNIVQQNFHGPITARNFYTVNSKGPLVQASA